MRTIRSLLLMTLFLEASALVAQTPAPVTWSGCGTAQVDGILSPGEWSGAATQTIGVIVPPNFPAGPVPATLYVMNDAMNIFVAIKYPESAPHPGMFRVEFDANDDGMSSPGDDTVAYDNTRGFFDAVRTANGYADDTTQPGGRTEGDGAYTNDGTYSVYEISHPIRGFDGYDLYRERGQSVKFFIYLTISDGSSSYDSIYPPAYDRIDIGSCIPPVFSGCGTPAIDGLVGTAEWASAGHAQFSVMTPQGHSAAGTLYVMNDSFNLYMALAYPQSSVPAWNFMSIRFDNDNSGGYSFGDDGISLYQGLQPTGFFDNVFAPACYPIGMCFDYDTSHGGTLDGGAAISNDGSRTAYEFSHPFNSGDTNDIALAFGDTVPFSFLVSMSSSQSIVAPDRADSGTYLNAVKICTPAPAQSVQDLTKQVSSLTGAAALPANNAEMLQSDLTRANRNLQVGKSKQAANDLGDFVKDVTRMMRKGDLSQHNGQPLIRVANAAMSQL